MHWTIIEKINENKDEDRINNDIPIPLPAGMHSGLQEMAQVAADKGLKVLGITDICPVFPVLAILFILETCMWFPAGCMGWSCCWGSRSNILDQ